MILGSDTEGERDSEDGFVWKKRKVSRSLVGGQGERAFAIKENGHI